MRRLLMLVGAAGAAGLAMQNLPCGNLPQRAEAAEAPRVAAVPEGEAVPEVVRRPLPTWRVGERAPSPTGLSGIVVDPGGAPVGGAVVRCNGEERTLTVVAGRGGGFRFDLPPGRYTIDAAGEADHHGTLTIGLAPGERLDGIEVEVEPTPLVFELGIGNFF
jgi:hypothetical protein